MKEERKGADFAILAFSGGRQAVKKESTDEYCISSLGHGLMNVAEVQSVPSSKKKHRLLN